MSKFWHVKYHPKKLEDVVLQDNILDKIKNNDRVVLSGSSGTGKTLIAKLLKSYSYFNCDYYIDCDISKLHNNFCTNNQNDFVLDCFDYLQERYRFSVYNSIEYCKSKLVIIANKESTKNEIKHFFRSKSFVFVDLNQQINLNIKNYLFNLLTKINSEEKLNLTEKDINDYLLENIMISENYFNFRDFLINFQVKYNKKD